METRYVGFLCEHVGLADGGVCGGNLNANRNQEQITPSQPHVPFHHKSFQKQAIVTTFPQP